MPGGRSDEDKDLTPSRAERPGVHVLHLSPAPRDQQRPAEIGNGERAREDLLRPLDLCGINKNHIVTNYHI